MTDEGEIKFNDVSKLHFVHESIST